LKSSKEQNAPIKIEEQNLETKLPIEIDEQDEGR